MLNDQSWQYERHSHQRSGSGLVVLGFFLELHKYMAVETFKKNEIKDFESCCILF